MNDIVAQSAVARGIALSGDSLLSYRAPPLKKAGLFYIA
jgi:hypothetical protein